MKKRVLNILIFLTILSVFLAGCKAEKEAAETEEEQAADTGALYIESSPALAQVYIGEEYKGDTPVNLYNLPVGSYEITVRKEGYADFKKTMEIKVGRTEEIDAALKPLTEAKPKTEEPSKEIEKPAETQDVPASAKSNKINLSSFAMYYDFDKMEFTETRTEGSDLFSRKYHNYVHFTILVPTKINVINKPINEAAKEDCIFSDTAVAQLFSSQTLCIKTANGVFAAGGTWQAMPTELELKKFG